MPGFKRDRARVKIIDWHIREYYPKHGPEKIMEILGEDRDYIMRRAHYLKIHQEKRPGSGKKSKLPTKTELKKRIRELEDQNKALRLELIREVDRRRA